MTDNMENHEIEHETEHEQELEVLEDLDANTWVASGAIYCFFFILIFILLNHPHS